MGLADEARIKDVCAIVPSLNPDHKFLEVVRALIDHGFQTILIVDDGSREDCREYFDIASAYPQCTILRHYRNYGKGRALKTAFNYYLNHFSHLRGAVTVDADNQHHIDDIVRCAGCMLDHPGSLVLGARDFHAENVPQHNRMGNQITIWVFNVLCGIRISDTQTGLRAMSNDVMDLFLDLPGERFEYETNMLIETKKKSVPIREVMIKTVYIEENKSSHFNPFKDSIRIYSLILKFLSTSIASFLIDLTVFTVIMTIFHSTALEWKVTFATVTARVISSLFNYGLNRNLVFRSNMKVRETIIRYYFLAAIIMAASLGGVYYLTLLLRANSTVVKIFVDLVLFLLSFRVQREWVFSRNKNNKTE